MVKNKSMRRLRRRRIWAVIGVLLLILILRSCAFRENSNRHFIRDEQGRAMILRGFNVNGTAKWDSLRVGTPTREDYRRMSQDWGFNLARFLVFWGSIEPEPGRIDTAYLDRVEERLDWIHEAGMYVVLDMHQDLYSWKYGGDGAPGWAIREDGEPFEMQEPWEKNYIQPAVLAAIRNFWMPGRGHPDLQDHYVGAFLALAERFRDHPAVLGYDLYNEPVLASLQLFGFEDRHLRPLYQRLIDEIRTIDQDSWIFFEPMAIGPNQGFRSSLSPLSDPRQGEQRLAYFPHIYTLDLDLTGKYVGFPLFTSAWAAKRNRELRKHNAPMLIGEFGLNNESEGARRYMEAVVRMNEKTGSGYAWWDYNTGGWGPINDDGSEKPMLDVLIRPYPMRTAGKPVRYGFKPGKKKFWVSYEPSGAKDSTVIHIPERSFPDGWTFGKHAPAEGTWRWDKTDSKLYIASPDTEEKQKIEIISIAP